MINVKEIFKKKLFKGIIVICILLGLGLGMKPIKQIIDNKNALTEEKYTVLKKGKNINTIQVKGNIESLNDKIGIYSDANNQQSKVSKVNYKVGDKVKAGDILAVLDSSDLQKDIENNKEKLKTSNTNNAINLKIKKESYESLKYKYDNDLISEITECNKNIQAAQIDLDEKKRNFEQNSYLNEYGAVSDEQLAQSSAAFSNAQNTYKSAGLAFETAKKDVEAALNLAENEYEATKAANDDRSGEIAIEIQEKQLKNCEIKATIDGTITEVNAKEGAPCGTTELFEIQNLDDLLVEADVKEKDIAKVNIGNKAEIETDSLGDDKIDGIVYSIDPVAEKADNDILSLEDDNNDAEAKFKVKIKFQDSDKRIMGGMKATIDIILEEKDDVYIVPYSCIIKEGDDDYIYIANRKNEKYIVDKILVTKGTESDTDVEITGEDISDDLIVLNTPSDYDVGKKIKLKKNT